MSITVGSILHGAYGDYYEQLVALRHYKRHHPERRLILFFASESRQRELVVFDTSFADEVHPARSIPDVPVDTFYQFQVRDGELHADVLDKLPPSVRAKIDLRTMHRPWVSVRQAWAESPDLCDIELSPAGHTALPQCMAANGIDMDLFRTRFTVGFLWRYRGSGGYISGWGQQPEGDTLATKSALLQHLVDEYDATVLVAGMNLKPDDTNRERVDAKFSDRKLSVQGDCRYLKGLSWGLELEILRNCSLCIVMASGFSEALWMKRHSKNTVLVDPPRQYLLRLLYYRMPFFTALSPYNWPYYWIKPHTADVVIRRIQSSCREMAMAPRMNNDYAESSNQR